MCTCDSVLAWPNPGALLVCVPAGLVEGELIDRVVEIELAGGLDGMELVLEGEGKDGALGALCVAGLDIDGLGVEVLGVLVGCWPNTKAGTRRTLAAKLDRRMEYLRHTRARAIPTYSSAGSRTKLKKAKFAEEVARPRIQREVLRWEV